ncbi:MAG: diacylglycerol kinase family protein [Planctomycetaceae bacterium]
MKSKTLLASLRTALSGCVFTWRNERNLRIQGLAGLLVVVAAVVLQLPPLECSVLVLTIGCVLALEMMNTAIERVVDLASPEYHQLAKLSKDVAAGSVAIAAIAAVIIGWLILGTAVWRLCF